MRDTWTIAITNLRRTVRSPILLITALALPFLVITVIGLALSNGADRITIGVVAHDQGAPGAELVDGLRADRTLHVTTYGDDAALRTAVRRGQVAAGVIVPADYGTALLGGGAPRIGFLTTPNQSGAATARAVLESVVDQQGAPIEAGLFSAGHTGRPPASEVDRARRMAGTVPRPGINTVALAPARTMRLGVDYSGPSNLTLFVILTSMTSAAALVESRALGVTRRMFALPVRRGAVLTGEFLGRLLVSLAQAAVILLFCALVFGVRWGDPLGVTLLTGTLCLFGAALGILVGFTARTTAQAIAIGPPLGVALGMLGGCMWPLSITGPAMRRIGHATPNAWAMDGYIRLINTNDGVRAVLSPVAVIAGMTVLLLALAARGIRKAGRG